MNMLTKILISAAAGIVLVASVWSLADRWHDYRAEAAARQVISQRLCNEIADKIRTSRKEPYRKECLERAEGWW